MFGARDAGNCIRANETIGSALLKLTRSVVDMVVMFGEVPIPICVSIASFVLLHLGCYCCCQPARLFGSRAEFWCFVVVDNDPTANSMGDFVLTRKKEKKIEIEKVPSGKFQRVLI